MEQYTKKVKSLAVRDEDGTFSLFEVGKSGVLEIEEHSAKGNGDKWYYDVIREDEIIRVFDFLEVRFTKEKKEIL